MYESLKQRLQSELDGIKADGLFKTERVITSPQGRQIQVQGQAPGNDLINLCANNYLGLSSDPELTTAAEQALHSHGLGLSSVRFICGTQDIHKELEHKVARFLGHEDTILYISCWDANGGLFETIAGRPEDAILSDALNHASIIDGVRLAKAQRFRYANCDMGELEKCLREAKDARTRVIVTDGVFSMDGTIAPLADICELADKHNALVVVDDSHATGFIGATGRGTPEHHGVQDRVDVVTSTFGKALGGACGGFTSGPTELVEILRQRSRPYLFSNTMPPAIVGAVIAAIDRLTSSTELRDRLEDNTAYFREAMVDAGFEIKPGVHPVVPVMLGDARLANDFANELLNEGIYVIGFFFPVVPRGQARIRVQVSAAHHREDLERAVDAFVTVGRRLGVLAAS